MYRLTVLFLLSIISFGASADPSVSRATLNDNGIEIFGSNFGAENHMLFWDNVSDSFQAQNAQSGDQVRTSSAELWRANTNQWGEPFGFLVSSESRSGKPDSFYYGTGHKNFLGDPNHQTPIRTRNELFVSWWYRPSMSPSAQDGSNKFIRVWDSADGEGTRISWTQMHLTCGNDTTWGNWNGKINEWNHHAIHINLNNNNVKTWINGGLVHNGKCTKSSAHQTSPLHVAIIGFDHGSEGYKTMTTAIDDIYISSSPARVEVSADSTWSATMPKEVLPITSWTNTKIVAKPVYGKIKLSNNMYIYVIDEQGRVNSQGMKVDCQKCPKTVVPIN